MRRVPREAAGAKKGGGRSPAGAPIRTGPSHDGGRLFQILGYALPPGAIVIALGVWFGLNLTDGRANYFGLDISVLSFTTTDYLTRSPDAVFVPVAVLLTAWLALIAIHAAVCHQIRSGRAERLISLTAKVCVGIGFFLLVVAFWAMFRPLPVGTHYLLPPLMLGASVTIIGYAAWVAHRIAAQSKNRIALQLKRHTTPDRRLIERSQPLPVWAHAARIVIVMLVILSVFWAASLHARALGNGRAAALAANLHQRPEAIIYSKQSLALNADGVTRERIAEAESAFLFRYSGLRLLVRSSDKYFLVPTNWTQDKGTAFVVRDTPDIRVDFSPGG